MRINLSWLALLALLLGAPVEGFAQSKNSKPEPLQVEETPKPFVSPRPRSQQQSDQLEALTLFAAGRKHEREAEALQRDKKEEKTSEQQAIALRLYERALRLDPRSLPILERIVPLAFELQRPNEGVRYALLAVDLDASNPLLVQRLALHLTEQNKNAEALKLYQKLLKAQPAEEKKSPRRVLLLMEQGRLAFLNEDYKLAAESFASVLDALEHAREFGLTGEMRSALLNDASKTYLLFAETFLEDGRYQQAIDSFRTAHEVDRDKSSLASQLARVRA